MYHIVLPMSTVSMAYLPSNPPSRGNAAERSRARALYTCGYACFAYIYLHLFSINTYFQRSIRNKCSNVPKHRISLENQGFSGGTSEYILPVFFTFCRFSVQVQFFLRMCKFQGFCTTISACSTADVLRIIAYSSDTDTRWKPRCFAL